MKTTLLCLLCFMVSHVFAEFPQAIIDKAYALGEPLSSQVLVVSVSKQKMYLYEGMELKNSFVISTAKKGTGQKENSFQTHKHSSEFSPRYLVDHRREPEGKEHDGGVAGNGGVPQTVQSGKQCRSRLCRYQDAIILAAKGDNKSYTSATFSISYA